MTTDEIRAMSRVVAQHFGLWMPGRMCQGSVDGCPMRPHNYFETPPHEISCPDLTEPAWSDTLGDALPVDEILFHRFDKGWYCQLFMVFDVRPNEWSDDSWGPTKRESLLLAAYQLVQREAPK